VRVILSKRVSVGHGGQVSWLTDKLSSNKWPTGHLESEMAGDNDRGIQMGDVVVIDWGKKS
jgi:hypothetical protein